MKENAIQIKHDIRTISKYNALKISKYYFTIVLSIISFYLSTMRQNVSSLYILIILYALPPILAFILKDYSSKHEKSLITEITKNQIFHLNSLKKKYKYSRLDYVTNSISFLITSVLICLWQINYSLIENQILWLRKVPFFILITGLIIRFLGVYLYRIKIHYDLIHNRL